MNTPIEKQEKLNELRNNFQPLIDEFTKKCNDVVDGIVFVIKDGKICFIGDVSKFER